MRDGLGIDLAAQSKLLSQSRALLLSPIHLWLTAPLAGRAASLRSETDCGAPTTRSYPRREPEGVQVQLCSS